MGFLFRLTPVLFFLSHPGCVIVYADMRHVVSAYFGSAVVSLVFLCWLACVGDVLETNTAQCISVYTSLNAWLS